MNNITNTFFKNGFVQRIVYALFGALIILALTALTSVPKASSDIRSNKEAIAHNSEQIQEMKRGLETLEQSLKSYIRDMFEAYLRPPSEDGGQ